MDWNTVIRHGRAVADLLPDSYHAVLWLVAMLWFFHVLDLVSRRYLTHVFAGEPRRLDRLHGVFTSHFFHAGFRHLFSNTTALLGLGLGVAMTAGVVLPALTLFIVLISGLAEWIAARKMRFVGASGIVFGYLGFILAYALLNHGMVSLAVGAVAVLVYRGILWGLLPDRDTRIGWEGHLTGFLAGASGALLLDRGFAGAVAAVGDMVRGAESLLASLLAQLPPS